MKDRKVKGTLIIEKVEFERMLKRTVCKNNKSSGKITLPHDLINKEVIVIIPRGD